MTYSIRALSRGKLPKKNRRKADLIFREILLREGVLQLRFLVWYSLVRLFGGLWLNETIALTPPPPPEEINSRTISP